MFESQKMCLISFIVPVYNSESYVARCFSSLASQSIDDIEVIFVDDHGKDNSIPLLQQLITEYAVNKRFRILSTRHNAGPGQARNVGIENAEGRYIAFVDSDDSIEPTFAETLCMAIRVHDADMALCNLTKIYPDGKRVDGVNPAVVSGSFIGDNKRNYLFKYTSYFTTYIYRRDLVIGNHIRFPNTNSAEDSCFLACCLLVANRIAAVDKSLYNYFIHPSSVSQHKNNQRFKARLDSFRHLRRFSKEKKLYRKYFFSIECLIWRKGYLLSLVDVLRNRL